MLTPHLENIKFFLQRIQFTTGWFLLHQFILGVGAPVQTIVDESKTIQEQTSKIDIVLSVLDLDIEGAVSAIDIGELSLDARI